MSEASVSQSANTNNAGQTAAAAAALPPDAAGMFDVEPTGPLKTRVNTRATLAERVTDRFMLANSHKRQQSASQLLKTLAGTTSGMTMRSRMENSSQNQNQNSTSTTFKKNKNGTQSLLEKGSSSIHLEKLVVSPSHAQQTSGNKNEKRTNAITWDADALVEAVEAQSITSPQSEQQQEQMELDALKFLSTTAAAAQSSATMMDFRDRPFAAPVTWGTSAFLQQRNCGTTHVAAYNRKAVEHAAAERRMNATKRMQEEEREMGEHEVKGGTSNYSPSTSALAFAASANAAASTNYPLTTYQQSQLALLSDPESQEEDTKKEGEEEGESAISKNGVAADSQREKLTRDFFSTARKIERADDDKRSGRVGHQQRAVDILTKRATDKIMQPRPIQFYSSPIVAMERLTVMQERQKLNCLDLVSCTRPKPNSEYKMDFYEAPEERLEDLMDNVPEGTSKMTTTFGSNTFTSTANAAVDQNNQKHEGDASLPLNVKENDDVKVVEEEDVEKEQMGTTNTAAHKSVRFHSSVKGGAGSPTEFGLRSSSSSYANSNGNGKATATSPTPVTSNNLMNSSSSDKTSVLTANQNTSSQSAAAAVPTCFFPNAIKKTMADFAMMASSTSASSPSAFNSSSSSTGMSSPHHNWTRWSNSVVDKRASQSNHHHADQNQEGSNTLGEVDFYASQMQTKFQPNANDASYEDYNFQRRAITNASTTFPLALGTAKQSSTVIPKYAGFMPSSVRNVLPKQQQQQQQQESCGGGGVWAAKADVCSLDINSTLHMGRDLPISSACISYAQQAQKQPKVQRSLASSSASSKSADSTSAAAAAGGDLSSLPPLMSSTVLTNVVRDAYDEESRDILRDFSKSYMTLAVHGDVVDSGRSMSRSVQGKRFGGVAPKPLKPRREEDIQKTVEGSMLQDVLHAAQSAGDTLTTTQVKRNIF